MEDHLKGGKSVTAICREYRVSAGTFRRWREQYHAEEESSADRRSELSRDPAAAQQRIEELQGAAVTATTWISHETPLHAAAIDAAGRFIHVHHD